MGKQRQHHAVFRKNIRPPASTNKWSSPCTGARAYAAALAGVKPSSARAAPGEAAEAAAHTACSSVQRPVPKKVAAGENAVLLRGHTGQIISGRVIDAVLQKAAAIEHQQAGVIQHGQSGERVGALIAAQQQRAPGLRVHVQPRKPPSAER